jgi:hypothetical protein
MGFSVGCLGAGSVLAVNKRPGAKQVAEKGCLSGKLAENIPQGLKPTVFYQAFAARLKSFPDAMRPLETLSTSFSATCYGREQEARG